MLTSAYIHTCIREYIHSCINAYINAYIHTDTVYIHPYIQVLYTTLDETWNLQTLPTDDYQIYDSCLEMSIYVSICFIMGRCVCLAVMLLQHDTRKKKRIPPAE